MGRFADERTIPVESPVSGYIRRMDTERIGLVSAMLGAGRQKKEDLLDLGAGIRIFKKTGDRVERGEPLCELYTKTAEPAAAAAAYLQALKFGDEPPRPLPLIHKIIR